MVDDVKGSVVIMKSLHHEINESSLSVVID
jgi:hypothetical protein